MLVNRSKHPATVVISKDRKTALSLAAEHNHPKIIQVIELINNNGKFMMGSN